MYAEVASDFAPCVRYMYNSDTASIPVGYGVERNASSSSVVSDPANENSPTSVIFGIKSCECTISGTAQNGGQNFIGVALANIPITTWGPVCIGGPCKIAVSASLAAIAVGAPFICNTTSGLFITATTPYNFVHAIARHATGTVTVAAGGLLDAWIDPIKMAATNGKTNK